MDGGPTASPPTASAVEVAGKPVQLHELKELVGMLYSHHFFDYAREFRSQKDQCCRLESWYETNLSTAQIAVEGQIIKGYIASSTALAML